MEPIKKWGFYDEKVKIAAMLPHDPAILLLELEEIFVYPHSWLHYSQ